MDSALTSLDLSMSHMDYRSALVLDDALQNHKLLGNDFGRPFQISSISSPADVDKQWHQIVRQFWQQNNLEGSV